MTKTGSGTSMIGEILHRVGLTAIAASLCLLPQTSQAQQQRSIPVVRDTEIEAHIPD